MQRFLAVVLVCCLSGCLDWSALAAQKKQQEAEEAEAAAKAEAEAPPAAAGGQAEVVNFKNPIGGIPTVETRVVDKQQALQENPNMVETENRITANDPISAPLQGLFAAGSKVEILAFTHTIQNHYALNEQYPTYAEFMDYYKQANVRLRGLKPWQVYAYDSTDGSIVLMEDPDKKAEVDKEFKERNQF